MVKRTRRKSPCQEADRRLSFSSITAAASVPLFPPGGSSSAIVVVLYLGDDFSKYLGERQK